MVISRKRYSVSHLVLSTFSPALQLDSDEDDERY
uniref:Uncharacterized protein n=1 Tax=Onchocerca volvulus TaxID=6282 RepID=A0A8R1XNC9_ONCVO